MREKLVYVESEDLIKKVCGSCKTIKNLDLFTKTKNECKDCCKKKKKEWRNKGFERVRKTNIKARYGLSSADYLVLLWEQKHMCAICGKLDVKKDGTPRKLAIDHDHANSKTRGLLCFSCNVSLGKLRDDPVLLRKAADYIEFWKEKHKSPED